MMCRKQPVSTRRRGREIITGMMKQKNFLICVTIIVWVHWSLFRRIHCPARWRTWWNSKDRSQWIWNSSIRCKQCCHREYHIQVRLRHIRFCLHWLRFILKWTRGIFKFSLTANQLGKELTFQTTVTTAHHRTWWLESNKSLSLMNILQWVHKSTINKTCKWCQAVEEGEYPAKVDNIACFHQSSLVIATVKEIFKHQGMLRWLMFQLIQWLQCNNQC